MHLTTTFIATLLSAVTLGYCSNVNLALSNDFTVTARGVHVENNKTHAHHILKKLYPDQSHLYSEETAVLLYFPKEVQTANATHTPFHEDFSLYWAGVYFAAWFSVKGYDHVRNAIQDCQGVNGGASGTLCALDAIVAATTNIGAALAGGSQGAGHMAYIARYARGVVGAQTGLPPKASRRRSELSARGLTCGAPQPFISQSTWPSNTEGFKVSGTSGCLSYNDAVLENIQHLAGELVYLFYSYEYWQMQGTYYIRNEDTSTNYVLMRTANYMLGQTPNPCPNYVYGGTSCIAAIS